MKPKSGEKAWFFKITREEAKEDSEEFKAFDEWIDHCLEVSEESLNRRINL